MTHLDWLTLDATAEDFVKIAANDRRWMPMPRGGHFAPAEEPELLARDIAAFFATYRPAVSELLFVRRFQ